MVVSPYYLLLCCFLALAVGVLAGFQGIYERNGRDSFASALTPPGLLYLLTRGGFPLALFILLYSRNKLQNTIWFEAILLGAASEYVLRSKIYLKQATTAASDLPQDILTGPLNLLQWYQTFFLDSIDTFRASQRLRIVRGAIPSDLNFLDFCERVDSNSLGFQKAIRTKIVAEIDKETKEYQSSQKKLQNIAKPSTMQNKTDSAKVEIRHKEKLGFALFHLVGKKNLKTLCSFHRIPQSQNDKPPTPP